MDTTYLSVSGEQREYLVDRLYTEAVEWLQNTLQVQVCAPHARERVVLCDVVFVIRYVCSRLPCFACLLGNTASAGRTAFGGQDL